MSERVKLASVKLAPVSKTMSSGESADHGAKFHLSKDKDGAPVLLIEVKLQTSDKEGKPLVTKKGANWLKGWVRLARTSVALFPEDDGSHSLLLEKSV